MLWARVLWLNLGSVSRSSLTKTGLPSKSTLLSSSMALSASSRVEYSTIPQPFERPLGVVRTSAKTTLPAKIYFPLANHCKKQTNSNYQHTSLHKILQLAPFCLIRKVTNIHTVFLRRSRRGCSSFNRSSTHYKCICFPT